MYALYDKLEEIYIVNYMLMLAYLIKLVSTDNTLCSILATSLNIMNHILTYK